ncbi:MULTISPECIES: hypothetical protein [Paenibacillus]|uniref:hypothetical protein n=1 Tax=Paenibacillus TaxID=44249 RepID=UPI002FE03164
MNENVSLDTYKYFIDAYFNMSYKWDDLEMTIKDFIELEDKENVERLLEEVNYINKLDDWEYLRSVNIETAGIYYDEARNREFIQILISKLSE